MDIATGRSAKDLSILGGSMKKCLAGSDSSRAFTLKAAGGSR